MNFTAIILAGGLGTRLREVVFDRPKVLAPAADFPFIHYVLSYLSSQNITDVILSVGYLSDQVISYVGDGTKWDLRVRYVVENQPLGTGGALILASRDIQNTFISLNGDTLFCVDLESLISTHLRLRSLATIALVNRPDGQLRGCVDLDHAGFIRNFQEKPPTRGPALVNGGINIFEPAAFKGRDSTLPVSLEKDIFPELAKLGLLGGKEMTGYFADIGAPESLSTFEQDIRSGRVKGF
jgi:D-glycero-alpha-D-manno-heptose 1-phosphate guanylyltransferase